MPHVILINKCMLNECVIKIKQHVSEIQTLCKYNLNLEHVR